MLFCPRYRFLRLELFKSIAMQDRNVYSILHCDRFVYLMNNDNVEIIKVDMDFSSIAYRNKRTVAIIVTKALSIT